MAVKKAVVTKKRAITTKKTTTKKAASPATGKGDAYVCGVCGLAVIVDEACGCIEVHDIICCGKVMKPRKARAKAKTAKATAAKKPVAKKPVKVKAKK
jgi:hypothetical protein